jgi:hypothetical protein
MTNVVLDVLAVVELQQLTIEKVIEGLLRETGSVESQRAAGLAGRARTALDQLRAECITRGEQAA